jgi:hypothetical protein
LENGGAAFNHSPSAAVAYQRYLNPS